MLARIDAAAAPPPCTLLEAKLPSDEAAILL
jgi:hypothetical protein